MKTAAVAFSGSAAAPGQFPRDGLPEVAFLGRSNVGKSSLLNALAGAKDLARVSAQPGRTRLVNFFRVEDELYLVDLPGYGFARVPESVRRGWETLVTSYLRERAPLALGVFLVDARHDPSAGDEVLKAYLEREGLRFVLVATKIDKLGRSEAARRFRDLALGFGRGAVQVLGVSARTGQGVPELWTTIRTVARRHREELNAAGN